MSLLSAKTAGISGHNRTTQAEFSTSTWYTFAGHVKTITVSTYKWWEIEGARHAFDKSFGIGDTEKKIENGNSG